MHQFPLRMPEFVRDRLRASAEVNRRSLNAEIVYRLEVALAVEPPKQVDPSMDGEPLHEQTLGDRALGVSEENGPAGTAIPPGLRSSNPYQETENEHSQA